MSSQQSTAAIIKQDNMLLIANWTKNSGAYAPRATHLFFGLPSYSDLVQVLGGEGLGVRSVFEQGTNNYDPEHSQHDEDTLR